MSIERVIGVPKGGAINHPWSPGAKYEANSTTTSSGKTQNLRHRRLLALPGSNSRSNSGQQLPNPGYQKSAPSLNDNNPKPGKGIRVRSIMTTDENGNLKKISYNEEGQVINGPDESKFLNDVDLARDGSQNSTDQHIQSETKSQAEDVHNQTSRLTKTRTNLTPVKNDKLTSEGDLINSSELTSQGRSVIQKTKDRRAINNAGKMLEAGLILLEPNPKCEGFDDLIDELVSLFDRFCPDPSLRESHEFSQEELKKLIQKIFIQMKDRYP